jgi:hypothetical protein
LPFILLLMLLASCQYFPFGYTDIGQITARPAEFEGKEVKVKGQVTQITKIPFIEFKTYVLRGDTGEIVVTTDGTLPAKGERIAIRGVVRSVAMIAGESVGLTIKELERLAAW